MEEVARLGFPDNRKSFAVAVVLGGIVALVCAVVAAAASGLWLIVPAVLVPYGLIVGAQLLPHFWRHRNGV